VFFAYSIAVGVEHVAVDTATGRSPPEFRKPPIPLVLGERGESLIESGRSGLRQTADFHVVGAVEVHEPRPACGGDA
jgi:hypothetical protein